MAAYGEWIEGEFKRPDPREASRLAKFALAPAVVVGILTGALEAAVIAGAAGFLYGAVTKDKRNP